MSPTLFALAERLHGHLGLLGLAVLLHPVITLRRRRGLTRGARLSALLAALLIALPFASGWAIYPSYRAHVKPGLVREAQSWAWAFETKEHLAFFTLALTLGGVAVMLGRGQTPEGRRLASALLSLAWGCGLCVGILGVLVAAVTAPAW
ncbi:MAG: hypothetical protein H6740_08740 [Alphaproteobacteria bacterium]|nr:hypothetical protein [Alphaproteobacteria bacterium]